MDVSMIAYKCVFLIVLFFNTLGQRWWVHLFQCNSFTYMYIYDSNSSFAAVTHNKIRMSLSTSKGKMTNYQWTCKIFLQFRCYEISMWVLASLAFILHDALFWEICILTQGMFVFFSSEGAPLLLSVSLELVTSNLNSPVLFPLFYVYLFGFSFGVNLPKLLDFLHS